MCADSLSTSFEDTRERESREFPMEFSWSFHGVPHFGVSIGFPCDLRKEDKKVNDVNRPSIRVDTSHSLAWLSTRIPPIANPP